MREIMLAPNEDSIIESEESRELISIGSGNHLKPCELVSIAYSLEKTQKLPLIGVPLPSLCLSFSVLTALTIESRALHILGKYFTTEPHFQPYFFFTVFYLQQG